MVILYRHSSVVYCLYSLCAITRFLENLRLVVYSVDTTYGSSGFGVSCVPVLDVP